MIPIKTPEGQAELSARQRSVSQRHRTVLFLADGKRNIQTVRAMAQAAGVPATCFDELVELGLIMLVEPTFSMVIDTPLVGDEAPMHVDLPLVELPRIDLQFNSTQTPSQTPFAESTVSDDALSSVPDAWFNSTIELPKSGESDPVFAEARMILARAVRAQAPLAGSLTLLRLRRARTKADLIALLDEVEARINKPQSSLAASQTMQRVRALLDGWTGSARR